MAPTPPYNQSEGFARNSPRSILNNFMNSACFTCVSAFVNPSVITSADGVYISLSNPPFTASRTVAWRMIKWRFRAFTCSDMDRTYNLGSYVIDSSYLVNQKKKAKHQHCDRKIFRQKHPISTSIDRAQSGLHFSRFPDTRSHF